MKQNRTAIVVGSTGLVGHHLILDLSKDTHFSKVLALSRRPIEGLPPYIENRIVNFEKADELAGAIQGTDLFFCFGTTLKTAGSKEKFVEIEWGISKQILEIAKKNGIKNVFLVSAMGASPNSAVLYSRIKGEIEDLARQLGFDSVYVLRPSLLLGERRESRFGEGLAQKISRPLAPLMVGPLLKFKPIDGKTVAKRLLKYSIHPEAGFHILTSDSLQGSK